MTQAQNMAIASSRVSGAGVLTVPGGGTSAATLAANSVLLGNGTGAPLTVAPGASGQVLTSNGTAWVSQAPGGSTPATLDSIGSVLMAIPAVSCPFNEIFNIAVSMGGTIAGSTLRINFGGLTGGGATAGPVQVNSGGYGTIGWPYGGTALTGTWRCVGTNAGVQSFDNGFSASATWACGMFVRIA